jgi:hypothetical protein
MGEDAGSNTDKHTTRMVNNTCVSSSKTKTKMTGTLCGTTPFGKYQTITKFHHKTHNSMLGKQKQG